MDEVIKHYKILDELGCWGVGTAYRARDTRVECDVALKFLPRQLTGDAGARDRFIREVRAASALDHPNICTIHDIDVAPDGRVFVCMPCYEGETLKKKIARGAMNVEEVVDIAAGIARGLAKAHGSNIIHGDIEPANVIITGDGVVKIVDFGVAGLHGDAAGGGERVGSTYYRSPEQIGGDAVDHRADIWSLGVTMYEMLTGTRPFNAEYDDALTYMILKEAPLSIGTLRPGVPDGVQIIVATALRKDREERYATVRAMLDDLLRQNVPAVAPLAAQSKSIAVIPFENVGTEEGNEYISMGLTEEINSSLSRVSTLRVISRRSVEVSMGAASTARDIGEALRAQYLLEGRVRKAGSDLHVTTQLVHAETKALVWGDRYTGTLDDVFEIQERVARGIVDALELELSADEQRRMDQRPIDNSYAYDCYLKAGREVMRGVEVGLDRAVELLEHALGVVGENAMLYAGLAYVYWQYVNIGARQEDHVERAEEYLEKTFAMDPGSPQGHLVQAVIYQAARGDQQRAIRHFKRALAADPNNSDVMLWMAMSYAIVGRPEEARRIAERSAEVDPMSSLSEGLPAILSYYEGKFDQVVEPLESALRLDPDHEGWHVWLVAAFAYANRWEEAKPMVIAFGAKESLGFYARLALMFAAAIEGDAKRVGELLTSDYIVTAQRDPQYACWTGIFHAMVGETDAALFWLETAVNNGFLNYPLLAERDPFLRCLDNDPRFGALMNRMKAEWEAFEA